MTSSAKLRLMVNHCLIPPMRDFVILLALMPPHAQKALYDIAERKLQSRQVKRTSAQAHQLLVALLDYR